MSGRGTGGRGLGGIKREGGPLSPPSPKAARVTSHGRCWRISVPKHMSQREIFFQMEVRDNNPLPDNFWLWFRRASDDQTTRNDWVNLENRRVRMLAPNEVFDQARGVYHVDLTCDEDVDDDAVDVATPPPPTDDMDVEIDPYGPFHESDFDLANNSDDSDETYVYSHNGDDDDDDDFEKENVDSSDEE